MSKERCRPGHCQGKRTKSGFWFCRRCGYNTGIPNCYRFGCNNKAVDAIIDKLAITPYKPVCADHRAGAKFRK